MSLGCGCAADTSPIAYFSALKTLRYDKKRAAKLEASEKAFGDEQQENDKGVKDIVDRIYKYFDKVYQDDDSLDPLSLDVVGKAFAGLCELYVMILLSLVTTAVEKELKKKGAKDGEPSHEMGAEFEEQVEELQGKLMNYMEHATLTKLLEGDAGDDDDGGDDMDEFVKILRGNTDEIMALLKGTFDKFLKKAKVPKAAIAKIEVDVKSIGGFVEKMLFRHTCLTDLVRGMVVVKGSVADYNKFVEKLLDSVGSDAKVSNVFLKPGLGNKKKMNWPFPFFMMRVELGKMIGPDHIFVEMQVVPEKVFNIKHETHESIEKKRMQKMVEKLGEYGIEEKDLTDIAEGLSKFDIFKDGSEFDSDSD